MGLPTKSTSVTAGLLCPMRLQQLRQLMEITKPDLELSP